MCKRVVCWGSTLAVVLTLVLILSLLPTAVAQETTGGLQGTVKDPSGAVVPGAQVVVTGTALVGKKELVTDSSGYYRFANLPPGTYNIAVTAKGFRTLKREGLSLEVGHLPTIDFALELGATTEVVEVTSAAPTIDVTTTQNLTNITDDIIQNIPHGNSYQSMIQFAPMARNEPLAGQVGYKANTGGTGGSMPGSASNGLSSGYSIGGAADSENGYLIEGQDTQNISGGYSGANVPFEFIQEVQIKSSGIEAEYGGALGGVVNVIMKKGGNAYHGQFFATYETAAANGSPIPLLRYDPNSGGSPDTSGGCGGLGCGGFDAAAQEYQRKKDHYRYLQPGVTVGGPVVKDRLWFLLGFAPFVQSQARTVDFSSSKNPANAVLGNQYFTRDTQSYYSTARLDASLTQKIRLFGSWLNQYARQTGSSLPLPDSAFPGVANEDINTPIVAYSHGLGWAAPNLTTNVGADITLTPKIVATTRFGYFFQNYHDFGWQTSTPNDVWRATGVGKTDRVCSGTPPNQVCNPLPLSLQQPRGTSTSPYDSTYTLFNANKHYQFNQDVAFFKGGWWGTHNIKVGYQFNRMTNVMNQNGNVPLFRLVPGHNSWFPFTATGVSNCALLTAEWGHCSGQYGYAYVLDFSTILPALASDNNHALFVQDSWNVGKGLTFNLGLRVEKEYLPAPGGYKNLIKTIDFNWTDKVAPRLGVAWDPMRSGKMKIFGSYGVVNDVMKLLLAQTSYGAQSFEECAYALGPNGTPAGFNVSDFNGLTFKNSRACPNGPPSSGANWVGGVPTALKDPSGVSLIENLNLRPWEPSAPGIKPYRQHEFVAGVDYQLARDWALEARYDRRRLDHILEDASLNDPFWGETYTIVNPGEGVNKTIDGYASYLTSLGEKFGVPGWAFNGAFDKAFGVSFGKCPSCPPNPKAIRNYDGLEIRLTKRPSKGWAGMFSYTWSSLWGNYAGLTNTDQTDGGAPGRNSPDTSRAFDEPYYYFGANGKSNNGPLPTDRPNTFKGYVYYQLPWKGGTTTFGLFQSAYQGSPQFSFMDIGANFGGQVSEAVVLYGRDKWVNMTQDPTTGAITLGAPFTRRSPWFTQSDFNIGHSIKTGEHQTLGFTVNVSNVLGQRAVTSYYGGMNSEFFSTALSPGNTLFDASSYKTFESGYNVQQFINGNNGAVAPITKSTWYGQPLTFQLPRTMRFGVTYTF
jgi:outer membrane receptor protein involved in Fe transport